MVTSERLGSCEPNQLGPSGGHFPAAQLALGYRIQPALGLKLGGGTVGARGLSGCTVRAMMLSMAEANPFDPGLVRGQVGALAAKGVFIGTSSWKYPGWLGQIYSAERYDTRGKFSQTRFDRTCLGEYAGFFPTVCVDAAYYQFPRASSLESLADQVPPSFQFGFKVTDAITIRNFPNLARFGSMAGKTNPDFLNPGLFVDRFLGPCEAIRDQVGVIMFEFSRFYPKDFERGRDFVAALDQFLGALPKSWPYAVEIRNPGFLKPDYFAALASHDVAHVFNAWGGMPTVAEQLEMPGSITTDRVVARFLLSAGRKYEAAVKAFSPYTTTQAPDPGAREAGRQLIRHALLRGGRPSFVFVNNRLEGNAPLTIQSIVSESAAKAG